MAIVSAMSEGDVEPTRVVHNALDVLAQIIVACVASDTPEWTAAELFDFVRQAYPYHTLTRSAFDETLAMLAGKYPSDVASELEARVSWDRITDTLTPDALGAHGRDDLRRHDPRSRPLHGQPRRQDATR